MDIEGDVEMQAAQEDEGSRPVCVYTQRSTYPHLVDRVKRRWQNLRIRWQNLMRWEPSQEASCVRIFHKVPGLKQSVQAGMHVLARGHEDFSISVVNVFFVVDSVHPTRRNARYSTFEKVGLVGGTVSMITGLTLLDVIEAIVVIAVIIVAKYKMWKTFRAIGGPSFNWNLSIPKFLRRENKVAPEETEMATFQPRPVETPQRSASSCPPPFHPYENLPGFIA